MGDVLPNPWSEAEAFDRLTIAGVTHEGPVELDASALLKKKSDHRRSRGRNGGRTVSTGWDLVEFSVTVVAWDDASMATLEEIIRRVGRGAVAAQDTRALSVSHPYLAAVGISQVTLQSLGFVPVQAGGKLGLKLSLKEWRAPTQAPGARTPAAAQQGTETARTAAKGQFGTFTTRNADGTTTTRQQDARITPLGERGEGREIPLAPTAPAAPSADP